MNSFRDLLIEETRRRLILESMPRIIQCLEMLSPDEIWRRPNANSNSIGNLVLHLCGNVRQWILAGMSGEEDIRKRQEEFDEKGPLPTILLIQKLEKLMTEVNTFLDKISPEDLLKEYPVQTFNENGISILVHVIEHFSYHTGQITYATKALKNQDTGYYSGMKLQ